MRRRKKGEKNHTVEDKRNYGIFFSLLIFPHSLKKKISPSKVFDVLRPPQCALVCVHIICVCDHRKYTIPHKTNTAAPLLTSTCALKELHNPYLSCVKKESCVKTIPANYKQIQWHTFFLVEKYFGKNYLVIRNTSCHCTKWNDEGFPAKQPFCWLILT